jgi:hypothetical protein
MAHLKELFIKGYKGKEVAENQFEVIEDLYSRTITYDEQGNVVGDYSYDEESGISEDDHYENGRLVRTDAEVARTKYHYDDKGELICAVTIGDHGEDTLTISYDETGRKIEDFVSSIEEHNYRRIYSPDGLLLEEYHGAFEEDSTIYEYNSEGLLIKRTNDQGWDCEITTHTYDSRQRRIETKTAMYEAEGDQINITELTLEVSVYEGDSSMKQQKQRYACHAASLDAFFETNEFEKVLEEVHEDRHEERIEGDKKIIVDSCLINGVVDSKCVIIANAEDDRWLKYIDVVDCRTEPTVIEKTLTYSED